MVAYFCWGGVDRSALYSGANIFSDYGDSSTNWARGAINYGVNAGYVTGTTATTYNPTGIVKGSELAKTLLVALGYKADAEDPAYALIGSNWELNSIRLAEKEGLFADLAAGFDPTAPLTREQAAQIFMNALSVKIYTQYNDDKTPVDSVASRTQTPMDKFFTGWSVDPSATKDDFGRPIVTYKKGTTSVVVGTNPTLTYTTAVTEAKLFADLGLKANYTGTSNLVVDGGSASNQNIAYNGGAISATGNGALTEVYYDGTDVKIVVINTYFDTVDSVTAATAVTKETATITDGTFEISGLKVNDAVLYTKANGTIKSMQKVDAIEVTPTSYSGTTSFVAGGTTYQYSAKNATTINAFNTVKIYLDNYGYVINIEGINNDPNYAVVLSSTSENATWPATGTTYKAQILKADGSVEIVEVSADANTLEGSIVTYTVSNGKYTLADADTATVVSNQNLTITKGASAFTFESSYNGNAKTIFLVRSGAGTNLDPYTYASYTGIANVPSLTATGTASGEVLVADGFAKVVYITGAAPVGVTSTETVFVSGVYTQNTVPTAAGGSVTYYTAQALVNGSVQTLNFSSNYAMGLYTVKGTDANGYTTLATTTGTNITAIAKYTADSGVITINSTVYAVSSNVAVYTYNTTTGAISAASLSAIKGTETAGVFTVDKDNANVVTAIYVPVA